MIMTDSDVDFEKLRCVFPDLPKELIQCTIKLKVGEVVVIEDCSFYPSKPYKEPCSDPL